MEMLTMAWQTKTVALRQSAAPAAGCLPRPAWESPLQLTGPARPSFRPRAAALAAVGKRKERLPGGETARQVAQWTPRCTAGLLGSLERRLQRLQCSDQYRETRGQCLIWPRLYRKVPALDARISNSALMNRLRELGSVRSSTA